jgi:3',5'-cyclic AMP phosphodiesterase CpdA
VAGAEDKLVGGPYVVNVSGRSATVMWVLETAKPTLGTEPGKAEKSAPALRTQKATFSGLESGKTYYYDIGIGPDGRGSFRTPATAGAYQFVVYGDTRTRHDVHRAVIDAILKAASPDFIVHTGDQVADGWDNSLWPVFFDIERELLRKAPIFPSLGNHERHAPQWNEIFNSRANYYSFNWGNSHFTVLDTDIGTSAPGAEMKQRLWNEQSQWMREDLEANQKADFRFLVGHHPPMTAVSYRQGDNPHIAALMPMLAQYKVTAAFFGHDHNYQHYLKDGIHYFVTGGGGAPLYDVDKPPAGITLKVARTENFVLVNIDGKKARFEARRPDGELLELVEIAVK